MISSKIIITLITLIVLIGAQTCPQLCSSNCTSGTCSTCRNNFTLDATLSSNCSCPISMFYNASVSICSPCPITCLSCTNYSKCTTCIPGYLLSNKYGCITGAVNDNGWISKNVTYLTTTSSYTGSNLQLIINNTLISPNNFNNYISSSCNSMMPTYSWFGGYQSFPYTTNILKSTFNLSPHQWVNIRFQVVIIDKWIGNTLLL